MGEGQFKLGSDYYRLKLNKIWIVKNLFPPDNDVIFGTGEYFLIQFRL